jgi:hypothetical protein
LDKYFMQAVLDIDISSYPEPLQSILRVIQIKGAAAAPGAFRKAMAWVWETEESFVPEYIKTEMNGIGEGVCAGLKVPGCNSTEWGQTISQLNMLPEVIRMACTAYGAWGKATATGSGLVQLRALDFGGGPFANYTIAAVYRDATVTEDSNAFVSITFPGFTGVITGVSERGIGVSEKVWMTYDDPDLLPGSYQGEADVFVLRDILQQSKNRQDAEAYLQQANRTWGIWIGIGDHESQVLDLVGYQQASVEVYTDVTAPTMTGQPYLESIAYVDKHPQVPTAHPVMFALIRAFLLLLSLSFIFYLIFLPTSLYLFLCLGSSPHPPPTAAAFPRRAQRNSSHRADGLLRKHLPRDL